MIKKIIIIICILFSWFIGFSYATDWWDWGWDKCWENSIKLNTNIPWIWKCIKKEEATDTFWRLMWALMSIVVNITVAVSFIALIASWVMMSLSWVNQSTAWKWKDLLKKVIWWIVLIWVSGIILHTINPNFFKTMLIAQEVKILKL